MVILQTPLLHPRFTAGRSTPYGKIYQQTVATSLPPMRLRVSTQWFTLFIHSISKCKVTKRGNWDSDPTWVLPVVSCINDTTVVKCSWNIGFCGWYRGLSKPASIQWGLKTDCPRDNRGLIPEPWLETRWSNFSFHPVIPARLFCIHKWLLVILLTVVARRIR